MSQLASLHEYLQVRNPVAAGNVAASIRRTIARLSRLPLLGKPTDEADVHVLVEPEYRYRVFYRVEGKEVMVVRVLRRGQD